MINQSTYSAKKIAVGLFTAMLVLAGVMPQAVHAGAPETKITGIAGLSGRPSEGITVWAVCHGHKQHAVAPTDAAGRYLIIFAAADCPIGSAAEVKVRVNMTGGGSYIGNEPVTITGEITNLDIHAPYNVAVPEYGLIVGIAALGGGMGAIIFVRRRQTAILGE